MSLEKEHDVCTHSNNGNLDNNQDSVGNIAETHEETKSEMEKEVESMIKLLKNQFNTTNGLLLSLGTYQQDNIKSKMEEMKQNFEKNKQNKNATREAISNLTWGYTEILTYSNLRQKERDVIDDLRACILEVGQKYGELKSIKMFADNIVPNFEENALKVIENSFDNTELPKNDIVSNSNTGMKRGSSILGPRDNVA